MHPEAWTTALLNTPQLQALGWALLQFVWQGTMIAAILAVGLLCFKRQPRARYAIGTGGMFLMLLTFLTTLVVSWKAPQFAQRASTELPWNTAALEVQSWGSALLQSMLGTWVSNTTMQLGLAWLTVLWVLGVLWFQVRLLVQWRHVDRLRHTAQAPQDSPLIDMVAGLAVRLRLRQSIRVLESTALQVPAVVGWFDPIVLVPAGILAHLTTDQLRAVLAHELAHLRRYDHLVNLVQCVTESLLFFHPAVWWLSNQIREDREYCCDDVAVEVCGDAVSYARALQDLEERRAGGRMSRNGFGVQQAVLAATGGKLMDRITRLFGVQPASQRSLGRWAVPGLMLVLLATALLAASCEPNLVEEPQVDAGMSPVEKATADQALVELHAGGGVALPFGEGGHFIMREGTVNSFEHEGVPGEELHELIGGVGALQDVETEGLHWVTEDGTVLDLQFFEDHPEAIVKFKKEAARQGAPARSAEPKKTQ